MKTVRIREKIKAFLAERPRNTAEILEHITVQCATALPVSNLVMCLARTRTLSRLDTSSAQVFFPVDTISANGQPASGSLTTIPSGMAKGPYSWIATDADPDNTHAEHPGLRPWVTRHFFCFRIRLIPN